MLEFLVKILLLPLALILVCNFTVIILFTTLQAFTLHLKNGSFIKIIFLKIFSVVNLYCLLMVAGWLSFITYSFSHKSSVVHTWLYYVIGVIVAFKTLSLFAQAFHPYKNISRNYRKEVGDVYDEEMEVELISSVKPFFIKTPFALSFILFILFLILPQILKYIFYLPSSF